MFKSINVLRMNRGREVITELTSYCERKGITSAIILGMIGTMDRVKLETTRKDGKFGPEHHEFTGNMSILAGQGQLSSFEGKGMFHIHMCLIDPLKPGELIGGHLEEGTVFATVEVYIGELDYQLTRQFDAEVGLAAVQTT